jgi:hypothetical protein
MQSLLEIGIRRKISRALDNISHAIKGLDTHFSVLMKSIELKDKKTAQNDIEIAISAWRVQSKAVSQSLKARSDVEAKQTQVELSTAARAMSDPLTVYVNSLTVPDSETTAEAVVSWFKGKIHDWVAERLQKAHKIKRSDVNATLLTQAKSQLTELALSADIFATTTTNSSIGEEKTGSWVATLVEEVGASIRASSIRRDPNGLWENLCSWFGVRITGWTMATINADRAKFKCALVREFFTEIDTYAAIVAERARIDFSEFVDSIIKRIQVHLEGQITTARMTLMTSKADEILYKNILLSLRPLVKHIQALTYLHITDWDISPQKIGSKQQVIGIGATAEVYRTHWHVGGRTIPVVVKEYFKSYAALHVATIYQEVKAHRNMDHPHIIRLYGAFCRGNTETCGLVMEPAESSLKQYLLTIGGSTSEGEKIRLCRELISAVEYVHLQRVVHRDITSDNVLVSVGLPATRS